MSNVSDLSIEILQAIRAELGTLNARVDRGFTELREEIHGTNTRVDVLTERVDGLTVGLIETNRLLAETNSGMEQGFLAVDRRFADVDRRFADVDRRFGEVNTRLDTVIEIAGSHHARLERRVDRIEAHLGLPRDH